MKVLLGIVVATFFAGLAIAEERPTLAVGKLPASKVLFLGNSITLHSPAPQIGWNDDWGMAASAKEKDYVHLVASGIARSAGAAPKIMVRNIAAFERECDKFDLDKELKAELQFEPDLVILAIGENVPEFANEDERQRFQSALLKLLNKLQSAGHPAIFVRSCFWAHAVKDGILRDEAAAVHATYVDISKLGQDKSNEARAERHFEHEGVAGHPGDKGMRAIAEALLASIKQRGE